MFGAIVLSAGPVGLTFHPGVAWAAPAVAAAPAPAAEREAAPGESQGTRLLRRVADAFLALETFEAEFEQHQIWVGMDEPKVSRGRLYLARPNRFRLEYQVPEGHLQVSDGERVWTYVPEHGEVLLARLDPSAAGGDLLSRLLAESVPEPEVRNETLDGAPARVLTLRPDPSLGVERLRVWTRDPSDAILQYEIEDASGNVSVYALERVRSNPRLDPGLFRFEPPAGVPVVEIGAP